MHLPNYFFADLPPGAVLSNSLLTEACQTLKRNRAQYLAHRSTRSIIKTLAGVGRGWLDPNYPFRQMALQAPQQAGFPAATLARGLDQFFSQFTEENLANLVESELGHLERPNRLVATATEQRRSVAACAHPPELIFHVGAGNIPSSTNASILFGVLLRSAQIVKCATGASFIPRLFAHSLYDAEPKLGACLEIAEWPGGQRSLEDAVIGEADCITVTGSTETLEELRAAVPVHKRFLGYGFMVSFGFIASEMLSTFNPGRLVAKAVDDIAAWNQLGCLSPHAIYVENGGRVSPEEFAALLAAELERREGEEPRGDLPQEVSATIATRRAFYEVRAAHSPETKQWRSHDSTAWTVVYEADPRFQLSCLHRFVHVKGVSHLSAALEGADAVRGKVSTVGLACTEDKAEEYANQLARWGVRRVCPLGQMQTPPLFWRHDGRPVLGDLVTWTDWEQG